MPFASLFINKYLFIFAALFPIVNPFGLVPVFVSLTSNNSEPQRIYLARRIATYGFLLLLGSMYIGNFILDFFGVSLPVVQLAGGMVIAVAGWRMLSDNQQSASGVDHYENKAELKERAFYPLTFPLTVGPGSVSVAITIGVALRDKGKPLITFMLLPIASFAAVLSLCLIIYLCFRHSGKLLRFLGQTGAIVLMRLSAFILMCLGVQIMWEGAQRLLVELVQNHAGVFVK